MKLKITKYAYPLLLPVLCLLPCTFVNAQELELGTPEETVTQSLSEGKSKEERRILDTYLFIDTTHRQTWVYAWKHNAYFNTATRAHVDTLINDDLPSFPFYKNDVGATFIGTSGGAAITFDYFKRTDVERLLFWEPYRDYSINRDNLVFYNTKSPFTLLVYQTSGRKQISEDNLRVLHTQNITPEWNVGLRYHRYGTRGQFINQSVENRIFTLFTSYAGKRYTAHAAFIYNGISNEENGGIRRFTDITDTVIDTRTIDVNLTDAGNKLRSNAYVLTQTYALPIHLFKRADTLGAGAGTMVYFGHALQYERQHRVYSDQIDTTTNADGVPNSTFFKNFFLNPVSSRDSMNYTSLDNRLFIRLQPWSPTAIVSTIDGGIGLLNRSYYYFKPSEFLYGPSDPEKFNDFYLYAKAGGVFRRYFAWNGFADYYLTGFRQGDMQLDANVRISLFPFSRQLDFRGQLKIETRTPDYFYQNFFSNRFKWNNSFGKTTETRIDVSLSMPDYGFELGVKQSLINNFVYFNAEAMPAQYSDALSVTAVYLQSNLNVGILHLDNRLLFQLASQDEVLPLPKLSLNARWYLQHEVIKSVMVAQFGIDTYAHTSYYMYAYNPAVGMFHIQRERQIGNFPFTDLFINARWKRATIAVKLTNLAMGMFNNEYFSAFNYPQSKRMLRISLSWNFYN